MSDPLQPLQRSVEFRQSSYSDARTEYYIELPENYKQLPLAKVNGTDCTKKIDTYKCGDIEYEIIGQSFHNTQEGLLLWYPTAFSQKPLTAKVDVNSQNELEVTFKYAYPEN